jgi:hypothetical protein
MKYAVTFKRLRKVCWLVNRTLCTDHNYYALEADNAKYVGYQKCTEKNCPVLKKCKKVEKA